MHTGQVLSEVNVHFSLSFVYKWSTLFFKQINGLHDLVWDLFLCRGVMWAPRKGQGIGGQKKL